MAFLSYRQVTALGVECLVCAPETVEPWTQAGQ